MARFRCSSIHSHVMSGTLSCERCPPDAPVLHAIVSESVGSCEIAADPDLFYSGRENRKRIVKDLLSFAHVATMSSVPMREHLF